MIHKLINVLIDIGDLQLCKSELAIVIEATLKELSR